MNASVLREDVTRAHLGADLICPIRLLHHQSQAQLTGIVDYNRISLGKPTDVINMDEASIITEEIRKMIGVESKPCVYEIEKGDIKRFAQCIEDPNPLWQDEKYAKRSRYGSIIAPPMFLAALFNWEFVDSVLGAECPMRRMMNASNKVEFFHPIMSGDVISTTGKLLNVHLRDGKLGKSLYLNWQLTYTNQKDQVVATLRQLIIKY